MTAPRPPKSRTKPLRGGKLALAVLALLLGGVLAAVVWARLADRDTASRVGPAATTTEESFPVNVALPKRSSLSVDKALSGDDPTFGGWQTEFLSDAAGRQLKSKLGKLIEHPETIDVAHVSELLAPAFACQALRPARLAEVFQDGIFVVRRPAAPLGPAEAGSSAAHRGADGLVAALKQLAAALGDSHDIRTAFKVYRVDLAEDSFTIRAFFEASSRGGDGGIQQNGMWLLRWAYPDPAAPDAPRLLWIGLEHFEEIATRVRGGTLFAEYTASAMARAPSYREQFLPGIQHWVDRISSLERISFYGHNGLAVGDANGDGLDDLYVCDEGGLPNRLYLQEPDGTLTDFSSQSGVDWLEPSTAALFVDLDNDGDQDLVVATYPRILFCENDGSARFTLRTSFSDVDEAYSLSAADYDGDGDLDIYICCYGARDKEKPGESELTRQVGFEARVPVPYHDANNGGANVLLRNEGPFQFVNRTREIGLDENNSRYSFAAAWEDYDNDGDLDLYVANDFGRKNLYRNQGGRFTDVAASAGVEDIGAGMSVSWGDYDRDGRMDLYVGNMYSSAGNRIAFQQKFAPGLSDQAVAHLQRTARGNSLFANAGDDTFRDVSESAAVTLGRWAWASKFADLNNDGWQDLVVTNGFMTNQDSNDL